MRPEGGSSLLFNVVMFVGGLSTLRGMRSSTQFTAGVSGIFLGEDGSVLDPAATPFVLMPDPRVRRDGGPCWLWIVTEDSLGDCSTELEMDSFDEAEDVFDAANFRMGWWSEEAAGMILASMGGGTA